MNGHAHWPEGVPRPRDYLETGDGCCFAVVSSMVDAGHALTSLRYTRRDGALRKLGTTTANDFLRQHCPRYLVHSPLIDAMVHRVPLSDVVQVHRPDDRLARLWSTGGNDHLEGLALRAAGALGEEGAAGGRLGLGGSLLLGAQHSASDIDLVVYGRAAFHDARRALRAAVHTGAMRLLDRSEWAGAWSRRGSPLTLDQYVRAEERKGNKAVIDGTRVDLTLVVNFGEEVPEPGPFTKNGRIVVRAVVTDGTSAFDHPARYRVAHAQVSEVVSFTPTYAGQAESGDEIEASGWLERDAVGAWRVVVGTSREAEGEYILRVT